jgi:hypothetical protein
MVAFGRAVLLNRDEGRKKEQKAKKRGLTHGG